MKYTDIKPGQWLLDKSSSNEDWIIKVKTVNIRKNGEVRIDVSHCCTPGDGYKGGDGHFMYERGECSLILAPLKLVQQHFPIEEFKEINSYYEIF